ncbi:MAG: CoA transferase, partial [Deltaproteobacteria bacterium]|nr:CoA transferase [Deltaproteobacteria bacterium]
MELFSNLTLLSSEQATTLPYLTYRLAQDGINVIRLENPKIGDPNRMVGSPLPGEEKMNWYYLCINAGKKAISLNMSHPRGQELLANLIKKLNVDVFATNQMPNTYEKLGISPERLRAIKPDLIWIGLTGFGPNHPEAAYDPILQARGGLMELTGEPDQPPQVVGIPLPDMGTSEHAYGQLMKALYVREKTGQGSTIHMSMLSSTASWLTVPITLTASFGQKITRRGNTHQFFAPLTILPTKDGYLYIAVGNDRQWSAIVNLPEFQSLNKPEYATNAGRIADVKALNQGLADIARNIP